MTKVFLLNWLDVCKCLLNLPISYWRVFTFQQTQISFWTLSQPKRPPPKLLAGIRAGGDASPPLIPLLLFHSTFSSGWHHTDNYNNYVWIQWQHCGIVTVSFFLHNCWDFGRANCSYNETSWAIILHPPWFFFSFLSPWLVNNAGYLCGDHSTHLGRDEKRKHKMSLPFRVNTLKVH